MLEIRPLVQLGRRRTVTRKRAAPATRLMVRYLILPATLSIGLLLGSCSPFAGFVSDHWPHWAGGMPDGVPPRPGAPGYNDFIAHGEAPKDATPPADADAQPASAQPAAAQPASVQPATAQPATTQPVAAQPVPAQAPPPPANPARSNPAVGSGGLY
jgi:hypothetical protein